MSEQTLTRLDIVYVMPYGDLLINQYVILEITMNFRAIFPISSELQRRVQNGHVQHCHGNRSHDHVVIPDAIVPLHSPRGAVVDNNRGNARPDRLRSGNPSLARRQV